MKNLGKKLGQIVVPMMTPFRKNGDVDHAQMERMVEHLIKNRLCDAIAVAGTTGEFNTLAFDERVELFATVMRATRGRLPLVAGTGAASTREAIRLTEKAEELGFDAAMVVGPYYCRPTQEGIYQHFAMIAASVSIPIIVYNIPLFMGVNIDPATLGRLAKIKNIVAVKDEAGINPTQMTDYARVTPNNFTIYNGDDIMVLCGLAQGAAGVISGSSYLIGDQMRTMMRRFLAGDVAGALRLHRKFDPFFKAYCPNGRINPMPVLRAALEEAGHPVGPARLPLDRATKTERKVIRQHLVRLRVISR